MDNVKAGLKSLEKSEWHTGFNLFLWQVLNNELTSLRVVNY